MAETPVGRKRDLKWLPIEQIIKNDKNPRQAAHFTPEQLSSLQESMKVHGVLQPVIVVPYDDDMFELIDGERRWTSAKLNGVKELPAIVINRMSDQDEVVVMYNVHTQHKGWEKADELRAIKEMMESNGHTPEDELARKLGMTVTTFKNRLRVLEMGDDVVADIAAGNFDYSSALRSDEAAATIARRRPELAARLGGEKGIKKKLLTKAKARKGISQELVEIKRDLADVQTVPDEAVEAYLTKPDAGRKELRSHVTSLEERRKVEDLSRELQRIEREIRSFRVDLATTPNLKQLRRALSSLIDAAQQLEEKVVEATLVEGKVDRK